MQSYPSIMSLITSSFSSQELGTVKLLEMGMRMEMEKMIMMRPIYLFKTTFHFALPCIYDVIIRYYLGH